jgi:hypothetical protein
VLVAAVHVHPHHHAAIVFTSSIAHCTVVAVSHEAEWSYGIIAALGFRLFVLPIRCILHNIIEEVKLLALY